MAVDGDRGGLVASSATNTVEKLQFTLEQQVCSCVYVFVGVGHSVNYLPIVECFSEEVWCRVEEPWNWFCCYSERWEDILHWRLGWEVCCTCSVTTCK